MQMSWSSPSAAFAQFRDQETQQLREGQLVGRMLLQRLATGKTGVNKRKGLLEALVRACAVYTQR